MNALRTSLAAAAAVLAIASTAQAATFSSQADFAAATANTTTETFDAPVANGPSITFANGTTSTKSNPSRLELNRVIRGAFDGFVTRDGFQDLTFDFGTDVFGFGGDFSSTITSSLKVMGVFDGMMSTVSIAALTGGNGFFGLTSDTAFRTVTFRTDAGSYLFGGTTPFGGETFTLDNLVTAGGLADMAPVPLPAAALSLMLGLSAFGFAGARRKRQA